MGFTLFKPADAVSQITGCRVGLTKYRNSKSARLVITIAGPLLKAMKLTGPARFEVAVGEGDHHGLMRIRPVSVDAKGENDAAVITVQPRKARLGIFYKIDLGHVDRFIDEPHKPQSVHWEWIDEGWYEFALPEWADKTRPKPKHAVAAVPPAVVKAKAAGDADAARQAAERKEAAERRKRRELFGDKIGEKMDRVAGGAG